MMSSCLCVCSTHPLAVHGHQPVHYLLLDLITSCRQVQGLHPLFCYHGNCGVPRLQNVTHHNLREGGRERERGREGGREGGGREGGGREGEREGGGERERDRERGGERERREEREIERGRGRE